MKIKNQVYIISFVSSIIPLMILSFFIFTLLERDIRISEKEKMRLILLKGEAHLNRMFTDLEDRLDILEEIYLDHEAEELQEYMEIFSAKSPEVEYYAFGGSDGGMYAGDDSDDVFPPEYDPRIRPWYRGALEMDGVYISEVFTHAITGKPAVTISKRVEKNGQIVGVMAALIRLEGIEGALERFQSNTVGNFFILDDHGHILISTPVGEGILRYITNKSDDFNAGRILYYDDGEKRRILYPYKMDLVDLVLVGEGLEEEVLRPVYEIKKMLALLIAGTFILTTILILIFGRRFSESIKRLSYIIDNVARGNYTKNMKQLDSYIDSRSELYLVKEAIKNMQDEIKKRELALKRISQTDALTEVYNKGAITEITEMEIKRSNAFGTEFSIIMFDLDHFKGVNDNYGHHFGDVVLKKVAACVADTLKSSDILGRYGGEEFLILLPDTGIDSGMLIAERVRRKIYSLQWENDIKISASLGVMQKDGESSFEELIVKVDGALYRAKKNGRNRVERVN